MVFVMLQIAAIRQKYDNLRAKYLASRKSSRSEIDSYIGEHASPTMSEFLDHLKTLNSNLSDKHPVCNT